MDGTAVSRRQLFRYTGATLGGLDFNRSRLFAAPGPGRGPGL